MTQTARDVIANVLCINEEGFPLDWLPAFSRDCYRQNAGAICSALTAAGYKIVAREPVDDEGEGTWWRAMRDAAT